MKKLFYAIMFGAVVTLSMSSCTEEEVKPTHDLEENGGGSDNDPVKKG